MIYYLPARPDHISIYLDSSSRFKPFLLHCMAYPIRRKDRNEILPCPQVLLIESQLTNQLNKQESNKLKFLWD